MKKNMTIASTAKLYQYFAILEISNKWRTNFTFSKFTSVGLCVRGIVVKKKISKTIPSSYLYKSSVNFSSFMTSKMPLNCCSTVMEKPDHEILFYNSISIKNFILIT